ncbi:hypothetical protein F5Y14DRAFT_361112 [Nemania sp. NC0429]|nr:hypothetical protein F5Y14DRAFT_361112 [Nemania sp. NC0429]
MGSNKYNSLFHFGARSREIKRQEQPQDRNQIEQIIRNNVRVFQRHPPAPSQYDRDEDKYKPGYDVARGDLQKILIAHDEDNQTRLKAASCSWDTVLEEMAEAVRLKSSQTDFGPAVPAGAQIASEIINVLPDEFGLGVIKGGLALIFEAAQRRSESREKILNAFETVPDTIMTINTAFLLLSPEEDDVDARKNFFATLLSTLPHLIAKLLGNETWYKKISSALSLYLLEEVAIDDILSDWSRQVANLGERVQRLKIKILSKFGLEIDGLKHQVKESETGLTNQIKSSERILKDQLISSETGIVTLLSYSTGLQKSLMTELKEIRQTINNMLQDRFSNFIADQASAAAMTGFIREAQQTKKDLEKREKQLRLREQELKQKEKELYHEGGQLHRELGHSGLNGAQLEHEGDRREYSQLHLQARDISRPASSQSVHARAAAWDYPPVTPMQLMGAIGVSIEAQWRDLNRVIQQSTNFDAESQGKARWLLKTPEFGTWFGGRRSSIFLVDGATTGQIQLVSSMSSFCAILAGSLIYDSPDTITLSFFAGLHAGTDSSDHNLDGLQGMMRCLIAQLLSSSLLDPNLDSLNPMHLDACRRHDLKHLCHVFVNLVEQLPPEIDAVCIVDGISWYEQARWLTDLRSVVGMFEHIVERSNPRYTGILKVLMTSPGRSTDVVNRTRDGRKHKLWEHVTLAAGHVSMH